MRLENKKLIAKLADQGQRLDVFLQSQFSKYSRNEWQNRIGQGAICINGSVARPSRRLNPGDVIEFSFEMRDEPETPTDIPVIFEDADYLVVNKPAGLPVHPSGIYQTSTVITILAEKKILPKGHLLHRLDRETSGVLMLAKHRQAAVDFQRILRSGQIHKDYLTIVEGIFDLSMEASGYIFRLPESRLKRRRFFSEINPPIEAIEVQTCRTAFTPVQVRSDITLVRARIFTGRMHQIRATLKSLGYPVVGDKLYGIDENLYFKFVDNCMTESDWRALRIDRCALHASRLQLPHPMTSETWILEAALPHDMYSLVYP